MSSLRLRSASRTPAFLCDLIGFKEQLRIHVCQHRAKPSRCGRILHTARSISRGGSGGILPQEDFVKLDARGVLPRPFLAPNLIRSAILQFLANRISIVATRTLHEVVIAGCARNLVRTVTTRLHMKGMPPQQKIIARRSLLSCDHQQAGF